MTAKEKAKFIIEYFSAKMPHPKTELNYRNEYELTVAVILSAQCTDKRVNQTTPAFFQKFPDFASLAKASEQEIFELIKSISYPNSKAKNLKKLAEIIVDKYNGKLPQTVEELVKLPGIGRKTANVLTSVLFHQPNMPVDTHVFRVSNRIGFGKPTKTPVETEKRLVRLFPPDYIHNVHHWLILHGRYVCKARNPLCSECGLTVICNYYRKKNKSKKINASQEK